jgi:epsin
MVFKGALRAVKNVTNGYSDVEAKVRAVTSNDSVIPSGALMQELAQLSYNHADYVDLIAMLDKRLNDKGKYWRHVYKSLIVVEYLLHSGSPKVAQYFRDNIYVIKTLTEFQHIDDNGRDVGGDVRTRARDLSRLLADDKNLAEVRRRRKQMRDRMAGKGRTSEGDDEAPQRQKKPSREEQQVERALRLSEQDEAERRRRIAEQGKEGLFDEPKPGPSNLIDLTVDESQPWQLQPQVTSLPPQMTTASYAGPALQSQFTAFDQYAQQAQYEAMLQAEYMRQQVEAAGQQQQQQFYLQQLQAAQYQAAQLQVPQQAPLVPQKTAFGSNNPFATNNPFGQSATPSPVPTPQLPQFTSAARSDTSTPALVHGRPASSASVSSRTSSLPPRTPVSVRGPDALSAILASAGPSGVDTFGNVGSLRYGSSAFGLAAQRADATGS